MLRFASVGARRAEQLKETTTGPGKQEVRRVGVMEGNIRRFEGKVVIVTGGGAGIGFATARRLAAEGARVALLDWSADDLKSALDRLEQAGATCLGVHGDAASPADCEAVVAQAVEAWGRLD